MRRIDKKYLSLEVIWKDVHMFELLIKVDNGRFSGMTEVYESTETLIDFAKRIKGFPNGSNEIIYSNGVKENEYFEMKYYLIEPGGKTGVLVTIEDKLSIVLEVYPSAIDVFHNELIHLANNQSGTAVLNGIY